MRKFRPLVGIAAALVACTEQDTTPPAPPHVDAVSSPTSLDTQVITGTAEFGSIVKIAGATVEPQEIVADPYTARWQATATLADGDNTLAITAVDAAGNESTATQVTIAREPIHVESISLRLDRNLITADDAAISVSIQVGNDEPVALGGLEVQAAVSGYPKTIAPVVGTTDDAGRALLVVDGLDAAGLGTIVVTATDPLSQGVSADASFLVDTGLPASVDLLLSDGVAPPADDLTVTAGTDVHATITVIDQPQNVIDDAQVALFTDAPGVFITGGVMTGFPAGDWRVVGAVSGTLISDVANLSVTPGPVAAIEISPATADLRAGDAITFEVVITDALGNEIAGAPFTLSTDAPAGTTTFTAPATFAFCAPGTWTVTADAGPGVPTDDALVSVSTGAPVGVSLTTTPSPAVIVAGEPVAFETTTLDGCGNVTADFVEVGTNAPGAIVGAGSITGLTTAGSYTIVARVPGTFLVDDEPLVIDADASTTVVSLFLTSHGTNVGLPIGWAVTAVDGFGNPIGTAPVVTTTDPGATIDPIAQSIAFATPGTHTVTATVGTASDSDFVVVTDFDTAAPTVTITSPAAGDRFAPGDTVTVVVSSADDVGLAEVILQATGEASFFETRLAPGGTTSTTTSFDVSIPGGTRVGPIELIAQAVDTSGNRTSTPVLTIFVDAAASLTLISGFTAQTLSFGGLVNTPRGVAIGATGVVYVASGASDQIIQIDRTSGAASAFTPALGSTPQDLFYYAPTNRWFTSATGPDRVFRIDNTGAAVTFSTGVGQQRGLTGTGGDLWSISDDDRARRFNPAAATLPTTANCTINLGGAGAFPGLGNGGRGILIDSANRLVVTENNADAIWRVNTITCGSTPAAVLVAALGDVNDPRDIVQSSSGFYYYVNRGDGRLMRADPAACGVLGCTVTTVGSGFNQPWGLAFESATSLIVTDEAADVVYVISGPF